MRDDERRAAARLERLADAQRRADHGQDLPVDAAPRDRAGDTARRYHEARRDQRGIQHRHHPGCCKHHHPEQDGDCDAGPLVAHGG